MVIAAAVNGISGAAAWNWALAWLTIRVPPMIIVTMAIIETRQK